MKTVKKNVYYCDFCNKKSLNGSHISKHEKHCTANPNRECGLCKEDRDIKSFIDKLKTRFEIKETEVFDEDGEFVNQECIWAGEKITLNEILDFTDGCPNCTFAILRQTKLNYKVVGFKYDYKKEIASWWAEKNKEEWEKERREMAGGCYY